MSLPLTAENPSRLHTFMGLAFALDGAVLVPRAETELLGWEAVRLLREEAEQTPVIIDMCCGSGNLALGIAHAVPLGKVFAADLTGDAVAAAKANVVRYGMGDRVSVRQGDLFDAFRGDGLDGRASMVVCNPPYISTSRLEGESAALLESEPREAFDGGPYGIAIQQRLVREAPRFIRPGGLLLFEFGEGQETQARSLLERTNRYSLLPFPPDAAGRPRVAVARLGEAGA